MVEKTNKEKFYDRKEKMKKKDFSGGSLGEIETALEECFDYIEELELRIKALEEKE